MKANYLFICRFGVIAILVMGLCAGCASWDQKIQDSAMTQKMKDWQTALQKKFKIGDEDSESGDKDKHASTDDSYSLFSP